MAFSNVASVTNHFATPNEGFTTTLNGAILSGATTVRLTSVSGLTDGTVFVGVIEPGGTKEQIFTGTVDTANSQIVSVVWTKGTNADHSSGVTIVDYDTGTAAKMITKGLLVEHYQTGAHKAITADSVVTPALTVTSGTTLPAGDIGTADIAAGAITNAKLSTTVGELGGTWQTYTPVASGGLSLGNGTLAGRYTQVGKTVHCWIKFVAGASTSYSASSFLITLPVTASSSWNATYQPIGNWQGVANGGTYWGGVRLNSTTNLFMEAFNAASTRVLTEAVLNSVPNTWDTSSYFGLSFTYEAA